MRFATEVALIACISVVACIGVVLVSIDPSSYAASYSYKAERLAHLPEPRLIVIGGSGVAIGTDSERLRLYTGRNVVNMGLYASLGLRFMMTTVDPYVRKGDVILIIPEHEVLQSAPYGSGYLLLETLAENPSYVRYVLTYHSLTTVAHNFGGWVQLRAKSIRKRMTARLTAGHEPSLAERLYSLDNFNAYGDVDSRVAGDAHVTTQDILASDVGRIGALNDATLAFLSERIGALESRGVRVYVAWAPLSRTLYDLDPTLAHARYERLVATIGAEHVIGTPEQFIFPDEQFLDGATHLVHTGKVEMTSRLASLLAERMRSDAKR